jgi:hypothetical protein
MYEYKNIRDELKKYKYIIYLIKNNKLSKLILKYQGTKKELINILEEKYKNIDNYFICYKFSFHTGTKPLQGGPLSITISSLIFIDNTLKNGFTYDPKYKKIHGRVWFQKEYLKKFGWNELYLDNMTKKLISGKIKLLPLVVNMYNVHF